MLCNKSTLFDTCVLYHREQYKICLPGILRKNKVLIKTYTVRVFFVLFLLSSYAVQSSRIPGILHSKRHTITCVFRGSPYFSEMTFIYLQGTASFRTISYPKPRKAIKKIFNNPWNFSERSIFDLNNLRSFISQTIDHALLRPFNIYFNTLNE